MEVFWTYRKQIFGHASSIRFQVFGPESHRKLWETAVLGKSFTTPYKKKVSELSTKKSRKESINVSSKSLSGADRV